MAVPDEQIDLSISDCLLGHVEGEPIELSKVTWQITPNLDLAPSRVSLATLEPRLGEQEGAEWLLPNLLEAEAGQYEYCVIDCPPHLGLLMKNALLAADEIVIPVDTGFFSLHGLTQQLATIEQISERNGRSPTVRVLPNQYDVRTKLAREILAELRKRFGGVVFETIINFNTKLKEGASFGQPITEFAPTSMGAKDFQKLARETLASEPANVPTADILEHVERLAADAERLLATTTTLVDNRDASQAKAPDAPASRAMSPPEPIWEAAPAQASMPSTPQTKPRAEAPASGRTPPTAPTQPTPSVSLGSPDQFTPVQATPSPTGAPAPAPSSAEEIDRKIERIYGVRQEGETVVFCSHSPDALEVQLAGDFNDWMPHTTPMRRLSDGDFEARLRLPQGRYRYRLVVDGRWSHDVHNPHVETNEYGELNSVVEIHG
jgi:chromosome partitioning protein